MKPAYCDYIADLIKKMIDKASPPVPDGDAWMWRTGKISMDLHPTEGYMMSTKKTMYMTDQYNKSYKITVEEA